jgi:hypothetical protein
MCLLPHPCQQQGQVGLSNPLPVLIYDVYIGLFFFFSFFFKDLFWST